MMSRQIVLAHAENFEQIVLAFDNNNPGRAFIHTTAENLFEHNIPFRVITLPENCKDINDYYTTGGDLQQLIDDATPRLEYLTLLFLPSEGFKNLTRSKKRAMQENLKHFLLRANRAGTDIADITNMFGRS